MLAYRFGAAAK